jgi:hypothetical protein
MVVVAGEDASIANACFATNQNKTPHNISVRRFIVLKPEY